MNEPDSGRRAAAGETGEAGESGTTAAGGTAGDGGAAPADGTPRAVVRLKKREERRLRAGHLWVFSNEVDTRATPLTDFAPGDEVVVQSASGRFVGAGYVNPRSLISVRLLTRNAAEGLDEPLLRRRLQAAAALRERWLAEPRWCRLVYGEADLLPGLVVDRYDDLLVGQITTAGMERCRAQLEALLAELPGVRALLWANDAAVRTLEGLPRRAEVGFGEVPDTVLVREGEATFEVSPAGGQKTGWYYDQRENRARLARYARGARVLDVFSYVGAWGVQAGLAGAASVTCVDSSAPALAAAARNGERNGIDLETLAGDAATVLKTLAAEQRRFDLVVLDPPALIPRRKDVDAGKRAYWQLNELALKLLADEGVLVSCSCSHHLPEAELTTIVGGCARHQGRHLQVLERGEQGIDHPVHPAIPETRYLKAVYCRVTRP